MGLCADLRLSSSFCQTSANGIETIWKLTPPPLRAAFGICTGCVFINDCNQSVLFQSLDAEIGELLSPAPTSTLLEDLVRLQAVVLYQIIKIFYAASRSGSLQNGKNPWSGHTGSRSCCEQTPSYKTHKNLGDVAVSRKHPPNRPNIFRAVYLFSNFTYGFCSEAATPGILPVSMQQAPGTPEAFTCGI